MNKFKKLFSILSTSLILGILLYGCSNQNPNKISDTSSTTKEVLRMAVAPYQDIALIVNAKETDLDIKYNVESVKNLQVWLRSNYQRNFAPATATTNTVNNNEYRLEVNYKF